MAFESVKVQLQIGGGAAVATWRQDVTIGSIITCSLSDTTGITAYHWWLMGRPEGSGAGGGGPEPLDLGTAATATFTIDLMGTYIVWCQVNGGQPNATTIRGGCAYLEAITDPSGRPLRLLGPQETDEDIADALVAQGWLKMLNRWLRTISGGGGGGGGGGGLFPGYWDLPTMAVGTSSPGDSPLVSRGNHSHLPADVATYAGVLFTAKLPDPYYSTVEAKGVLPFGEGYGFEPGGTLWENTGVSGGVIVWKRADDGPLLLADSTGASTIPTVDGDLVAVPQLGASAGGDAPYLGLYVILDCGYHWDGNPAHAPVLSYPIIMRVPGFQTRAEMWEAGTPGRGFTYRIATNGYHGGEYVTLTTDPAVVDTTPLTTVFASSFTPLDQNALVKTDALSRAATGNEIATAGPYAGHPDTFSPGGFISEEGVLGITEVSAGNYRVTLELSCLNPDAGDATVFAVLQILDATLTPTTIGGAETIPIKSSTYAPYTVVINWPGPSALPFNPATDHLALLVTGTSTAAGGQALSLRWNGTWVTRIETPMSFSVSGTTDHQALDNRFPNVGAGTAPAHDWNGIGPSGREHHVWGTATITDGIVSWPANTCFAKLAMGGSTEILGINATGFLATATGTTELRLLITDASPAFPKWLRTGASVSAPAVPLIMRAEPGPISSVRQDMLLTDVIPVIFLLDNAEPAFRYAGGGI